MLITPSAGCCFSYQQQTPKKKTWKEKHRVAIKSNVKYLLLSNMTHTFQLARRRQSTNLHLKSFFIASSFAIDWENHSIIRGGKGKMMKIKGFWSGLMREGRVQLGENLINKWKFHFSHSSLFAFLCFNFFVLFYILHKKCSYEIAIKSEFKPKFIRSSWENCWDFWMISKILSNFSWSDFDIDF